MPTNMIKLAKLLADEVAFIDGKKVDDQCVDLEVRSWNALDAVRRCSSLNALASFAESEDSKT